jgi:hypothetical protein
LPATAGERGELCTRPMKLMIGRAGPGFQSPNWRERPLGHFGSPKGSTKYALPFGRTLVLGAGVRILRSGFTVASQQNPEYQDVRNKE